MVGFGREIILERAGDLSRWLWNSGKIKGAFPFSTEMQLDLHLDLELDMQLERDLARIELLWPLARRVCLLI